MKKIQVHRLDPHPEREGFFIVNDSFVVSQEHLHMLKGAERLLNEQKTAKALPSGGSLFLRCLEAFMASGVYVSESPQYFSALAPCFLFDLMNECPLLRQRFSKQEISHKVDGPVKEFGVRTEETHKLDLVIGPRAQMAPTTPQQTAHERLGVLKRDFRNELRSDDFQFWYYRRENPVHFAHLAGEAKATMSKANITVRYMEIDCVRRWVHEIEPKTVLFSLNVVNTSDRVSTENTIQTLLGLRVRSHVGQPGLDANIIVPFGPRVVSLPEHVRYEVALRELARRYEAVWPERHLRLVEAV